MNIFLKINEEELGRLLLAYHRKVFGNKLKLGAVFLLYYGIMGYKELAHLEDNEALEYIKNEFIGGYK